MVDDQQWLTYWIIYSFITLFELSFWKVLAWLPFWSSMKLVFCMWLVLPAFNGAAYIYDNVVRKYVKIGGIIDLSNGGNKYSEEQRKVLQMMSLDARKSVVDYVNRYGWDALDRAIKAVRIFRLSLSLYIYIYYAHSLLYIMATNTLTTLVTTWLVLSVHGAG
ncbi:unnamed protein product [Linum tenue]|uniref:HVA22-like protein n=1 Tax=Linum tenue TaxID=586396 RepID=A0AAV0NSL5_9ROSI|nr:unnamed protein product [Linum tenue]